MSEQTQKPKNPRLTIKNVRLAFPDLFEATSFEDSEPSYKATFIFPPDHPQIQEVRKAMQQAAKTKWGEKAGDVYRSLTASNRLAFRSGEDKAHLDGFAGNFYISSSNKTRPTVIDRDRSPLTAKDGRPYGGCFVNAIIEFWPQDNKWGKRINASLAGVQFLRDGDAFSGGAAAQAEDFEDLGFDGDEGGASSGGDGFDDDI
jgi:hypothetical protein